MFDFSSCSRRWTEETGAFADKLCAVEFVKREFLGVILPDVVLSSLDTRVLLKHLGRSFGMNLLCGEKDGRRASSLARASRGEQN